MSKINDPDYLRYEQYHNADRLNARINLHANFSTNPYGWFKWVFDQYQLPAKARILELGGGPGDLCLENINRIPVGWVITISDFSSGMVSQARQNLKDSPLNFRFVVLDAQSIPYAANHFDAVIANHCLFHVPDRAKALSEINRVLAPNGQFYGITIGDIHMQELPQLVANFDRRIEDAFDWEGSIFSLEKGLGELEVRFDDVQILRYPDMLRITDAGALVSYVISTTRLALDKYHIDDFTRFIEHEMEVQGGAITIKKDSGMFVANLPSSL
jgi:SAM-dependent methyltransferase